MALSEVFYKEPKQPITGTSGDDLILVETTSALTATDTIDGGEGFDTLRISAEKTGKYIAPSGLTNVEVIEISESLEETSSSDPDSNLYMGTANINVDARLVTSGLTIRGNDGINELIGGSGADTLYGNAGNDILDGKGGANQLYGGAGNDILVFSGSSLEDTIDGGDGIDTLLYSGTGTLILDGSTLAKLTSIEVIALGSITGGKLSAKDITPSGINAGVLSQNLKLTGNAGANQINGGSGNDTLKGGGGADTLKGGAGDDTFEFYKNTELVAGTVIDGGDGTDTVSFLGSGIYKLKNVTLTDVEKIIIGGKAAAGLDLTGYTGTAGLTVIGNKAANAVTGLELKNEIFIGGGGADKFDGGKITTTGSAGSSDRFVFLHASEARTATLDGGASLVTKSGGITTTTVDPGTDIIIFNETMKSNSTTFNTLVLNSGKVKNIEKVVIWSDTVTGASGDTYADITGTTGKGTLNLNVNAAKLTTGIAILGNDGINRIAGGKGADTLTGGEGSDTFIYEAGSTGNLSKAIATPTALDGLDDITKLMDTITDWDSAVSNNDIIDYKTAISLGNTAAITDPAVAVTQVTGTINWTGPASASVAVTGIITPAQAAMATIDPATGEATFTGTPTLYDQAVAVALALDAKAIAAVPLKPSTLTSAQIAAVAAINVGADGPKTGEMAYFTNGGDTYVFISDGQAGKAPVIGKAYIGTSAATAAATGTVGHSDYIPEVKAITKAIPGKAGVAGVPLTSGDVLIKLTGDQTAGAIAALIDAKGNLLFTTDTSAGGSTTGGTTVLTTGTDTVTLTLGDDIIDGRVLNSLNEAIVDAYTTDNDTLNATINSDLTPIITKIENVNIIDQSGGHTLTATSITGVKQLTLDSTTGNSITLSGVDGSKIATIKAGDNITDLTVIDISNNPTLIQNKATTISLDDASAGTNTATINLSGTALSLVGGTHALQDLVLVSGSTPSVVTLGSGVVVHATDASILIKGNSDVTLKASAADLDSSDKIAVISDTLSGSAKFHVDLTTVGTTADLGGISADDFAISSTTPLGASVLTFKAGITNLSLNANVGDGIGGFSGAGTTDVLNLTINTANTNLTTAGFETVNLTNNTGNALVTTLSNFDIGGVVNLTSSQNVTLNGATFKSIDATNVTGTFSVTGTAMTSATTIKSNSNAALIDMSLSAVGGNNTITTGDLNDVISIGAGNDTVDAKGGNDIVKVSANAKWDASDNLKGGDGTDTLVLTGNIGAASDLSAGGSKFTGFEKISVADSLTSGAGLAITLADASVAAGTFIFEALQANTVGVSFNASQDTNALFTVSIKSALDQIDKNVIKTGDLKDTISFDGAKAGVGTGGKVAITGGKGADTITLSNTAGGSKIVLNKGDTGSVTTLVNGMSVTTMDVVNGFQDGDILDLSAFANSTYSVVKDPTNNFFTTMPALANNSVYQVKGTYNPTLGTFAAGNTATDKDSLFVYDSDATVGTAYQGIIAVNYAKDSTQSLASGLLTLGSTGVLLTTGTDDFTQTTGARAAELTADNNIIDGNVLNTLNTLDVIDDPSAADNDVLNALVSSSITPATINQVENVNITFSTGGQTLTATAITKVKELVVNNVTGTGVTVANVTGGTANIEKLKAGDNITALTVTGITGTTAGSNVPVIVQNNATALNLSGSADNTQVATVNLSGTPLALALASGGNALLTLNLVSSAASTVTLGAGLIDVGTAAGIKVFGTGDITLKADAADLAIAKIATITKDAAFTTSGAKLHVDLTTVDAATDLSGITADDFTISSTSVLTGALTFKDGETDLTLAKNVVTSTFGFTAKTPASIATNILNLTETVANTNLVTTNYGIVNLTNSTNNPLAITTTTVTGAALNITSTRDVTLGAATFASINATNMTGSAKLTVTAVAATTGATVIGNQNDTVVNMVAALGQSTITTFAGNDILTGGVGGSIIDSGAGNDIIDLTATTAAAVDNVVTGDGSDAVSMAIGQWNLTTADTLQGGAGNDTLTLTGTGGTAAMVALTAANFNGFEGIVVEEANTAAVSITLAEGSASGAMAFTATQLNTGAITFNAGLDTDTVFTVNVNSTSTANVIKTGALNDTIVFDGSTGSAGTVSITAGKGGDSITLQNTLAAGGSTLVLDKGDSTVLTTTSLALAGTLNLSALTTDVITGLKEGDMIDLSAISTGLTSQGLVVPTALIPVAFANNQVYQINGDYAAGVFTEATAGADSIIVYDADATAGTSFEAIVLVGYSDQSSATVFDLTNGVLTLAAA